MKILIKNEPNKDIVKLPWDKTTKSRFEGYEIIDLESGDIIWREGTAYTLEEEHETL